MSVIDKYFVLCHNIYKEGGQFWLCDNMAVGFGNFGSTAMHDGHFTGKGIEVHVVASAVVDTIKYDKRIKFSSEEECCRDSHFPRQQLYNDALAMAKWLQEGGVEASLETPDALMSTSHPQNTGISMNYFPGLNKNNSRGWGSR